MLTTAARTLARKSKAKKPLKPANMNTGNEGQQWSGSIRQIVKEKGPLTVASFWEHAQSWMSRPNGFNVRTGHIGLCKVTMISQRVPELLERNAFAGSARRAVGGRNISNNNQKSSQSSIDPSEILKFAAMAETWWDHRGPYKALHAMNPTRLAFIRTALCRHFRKSLDIARPLEGLRILDVGCGGGLACEPLARMGAHVMGIDAVEKNIRVAAAHAARDPVTSSVNYQNRTAEQLVQEKERFDVVLALEIVEHVADPKDFLVSLSTLTNDNGMVVVSTINRSIRSYVLAIVAAEYVLGWVPRGTHEWSKFVTPEELALLMKHSSLSMEEMAGMIYNPISRKWLLSDDTSVDYIAYGVKLSQ